MTYSTTTHRFQARSNKLLVVGLLTSAFALATQGCGGLQEDEDYTGPEPEYWNDTEGETIEEDFTNKFTPSDITGELEDEVLFRVPSPSGDYVYAASPSNDSVAVINTKNLQIQVVDVARNPTVIRAITRNGSDKGSVAVLCQGADQVALLRTNSKGSTKAELINITPGANDVAVDPAGRFLIVYHNILGTEPLGSGSDQEITILDIESNAQYKMSVGAHPSGLRFSSDGAIAYVITADGVNVIEMSEVATTGKPRLVPVHTDPAIDPDDIEVQLAADQGQALVRTRDSNELIVTSLDDGSQFTLELPAEPTDLDIVRSGDFAIITMPGVPNSHYAELQLPATDASDLVTHVVANEYVGLANLSSDGERAIFYTTVASHLIPDPDETIPGDITKPPPINVNPAVGAEIAPEYDYGLDNEVEEEIEFPEHPNRRITLSRRDSGEWKQGVTLFVETPVNAIGITPKNKTALLLHQEYEVDSDPNNPWAYTLLDLQAATPTKKRQGLPAKPIGTVVTPDGSRGAVLLRNDTTKLREADLINFDTFIVERLKLGSPPEGAGFVKNTGKIFISQAHPSGRLTLIDEEGGIETITGFQLNEKVKD